jgi:hypothetical protein
MDARTLLKSARRSSSKIGFPVSQFAGNGCSFVTVTCCSSSESVVVGAVGSVVGVVDVVLLLPVVVESVDSFGGAAGNLNCFDNRYKNTKLVRNAISSEQAVASISRFTRMKYRSSNIRNTTGQLIKTWTYSNLSIASTLPRSIIIGQHLRGQYLCTITLFTASACRIWCIFPGCSSLDYKPRLEKIAGHSYCLISLTWVLMLHYNM